MSIIIYLLNHVFRAAKLKHDKKDNKSGTYYCVYLRCQIPSLLKPFNSFVWDTDRNVSQMGLQQEGE